MINVRFSYVTNERGNTMMLSLMIVFCFVFLAFVFFDVFSTYAYKNASQKAADAAALAAATEAKDIYEEALAEKLEEKLTLEEEREGSEEERKEGAIPESVIEKIKDASRPLANEALLFFFTDREITHIMCASIKDNWSDIEDKANYFARKNGGGDIVEMEFPYDRSFEIYVSNKTEASFITVPDAAFREGQRDMYTDASVQIPLPKGVTFVPGSCY